MIFFVGEKVLASGKTWIVSNKHPNKKAYFLKNDDGKGWWFDEDQITKIMPEVKPMQTDRQKAIEKNHNSRSKHYRKGTKSFLMLE